MIAVRLELMMAWVSPRVVTYMPGSDAAVWRAAGATLSAFAEVRIRTTSAAFDPVFSAM